MTRPTSFGYCWVAVVGAVLGNPERSRFFFTLFSFLAGKPELTGDRLVFNEGEKKRAVTCFMLCF